MLDANRVEFSYLKGFSFRLVSLIKFPNRKRNGRRRWWWSSLAGLCFFHASWGLTLWGFHNLGAALAIKHAILSVVLGFLPVLFSFFVYEPHPTALREPGHYFRCSLRSFFSLCSYLQDSAVHKAQANTCPLVTWAKRVALNYSVICSAPCLFWPDLVEFINDRNESNMVMPDLGNSSACWHVPACFRASKVYRSLFSFLFSLDTSPRKSLEILVGRECAILSLIFFMSWWICCFLHFHIVLFCVSCLREAGWRVVVELGHHSDGTYTFLE